MTDFRSVLRDTLDECAIPYDDRLLDDLTVYDRLLVEWNTQMNLTALTEPRDVALKHFADSLAVLKYADIPMGASVIDVGTGAGFPGLVLRIARPDIRLTLLDSLHKRLVFLDAVCRQLGIDDVGLVHARAEDAARGDLRDTFDVAVSRAVAPLNILAEYTLPFVKVGGRLLAMKGKDALAEAQAAQSAFAVLSAERCGDRVFTLAEAGERAVICVCKTAPTDPRFPRTSKKIKTKPL